jgi:hypothetical protein
MVGIPGHLMFKELDIFDLLCLSPLKACTYTYSERCREVNNALIPDGWNCSRVKEADVRYNIDQVIKLRDFVPDQETFKINWPIISANRLHGWESTWNVDAADLR